VLLLATIAVVVLGLTIAAFALKNALLLIASTIGWTVTSVMLSSQTFSNDAIKMAVVAFGFSIALICAIGALTVFMSSRKKLPPIDEEAEYLEEVRRATRRR
jgi:cation transporter-like permease